MKNLINDLFGASGNKLYANVEYMGYPYLLRFTFDANRTNDGVPMFRREPISILLREYCRIYLDRLLEGDTRRARERLNAGIDSLAKTDDFPAGPFGVADLAAIEEITSTSDSHQIKIGLSGSTIEVRRFGDCLGIKVVSRNMDQDLEATAILDRIVESRMQQYLLLPFIHRISFTRNASLSLEKSRMYAFDLAGEIAAMREFTPSVKWKVADVRLAEGLIADYLDGGRFGQPSSGIVAATHGDMEVLMRLYVKGKENESTWRRGTFALMSDSKLMFHPDIDHSNLMIEYSVRSKSEMNPSVLDATDHEIDYNTEHWLMLAVARKLYAGLFEREYESMVAVNPHLTRLRKKQQAKAAA